MRKKIAVIPPILLGVIRDFNPIKGLHKTFLVLNPFMGFNFELTPQ
jgi:hypothetical protein